MFLFLSKFFCTSKFCTKFSLKAFLMQPTVFCLESRGCLGISLPTYGLYRIGTEPAKPLKRPELNPALRWHCCCCIPA